MNQVIQIENLVDEQRIDGFNINLLIWSFLTMFADGYDISAMAFAVPELSRLWQIDPSGFTLPLTASLFGILFGAPALGFIGDRYGRKVTIILGCIIFGVTTLAVIWTESPTQIALLRFLTGIGIGGLMPNTIVLNSELSPKRLRATLVVLMFTGITLGSSAPGWIAAWLVPHFGWQVLFIIGGVGPLLVAVCLKFTLPESVKYLSQHPSKRGELLQVTRRMRRDLNIPEDTEFSTTGELTDESAHVKQLFVGSLGWITPLLWLLFGTALMANYFLTSWLPLIFENSGMPARQAAIATSLYHIGGTVGGVVISVLLDRFGFVIVATMFGIAGPAVAAVGIEGLSHGMLTLIVAFAGFAVLGAQFGNNASAGLLYPTAVRAKGVGWAFAIGRFGSILGPSVGGLLIAMRLPTQQMFTAAAVPMVVGVVAAAALARLAYKRFAGFQLDDHPAAARGP